MESIVFFGKGGIGKSTIAANISVLFAAKGRKVLHVGCDPKMDSTLSLMGRRIRPFSEQGGSTGETALRRSLHRSIKGIDCIEAGGPQAGVGCAGAGIGAMLDAIKDSGLIEKEGYDTVVFDVLGDVVCGGFAAPLRRGFASKAVLVVSEELLSLYAANNLISMVNNYARNGVYLAGLAVNAKDFAAVKMARDFAKAANTKVLGVVPRDPAVTRAEKARKPVVALEPRSEAAKSLARLAAEIASTGVPASPPRTLGEAEFEAFMNERPFKPAAKEAKTAAPPARKSSIAPAALLEKHGFSMTGVTGGQVVCSWKGSAATFRLFIAPAADTRQGMLGVSDWAYCFLPGEEHGPEVSHAEFDRALKAVSGLRFDDFISAFSGSLDFYGNVGSFEKLSTHPLLPDGDRPREPHTAFGQWQRFIYSDSSGICVPPGSVMVEHGDNECRFSSCSQTPLSTFQKIAGLAGNSSPSLGPLLPKEDNLIVNTDFLYEDAIRGDEKKIADTIAAAAARTGPGGLVEFYNGCSPLIMASDVTAFSDKAARDLGVEVLRENFNSFSAETPEKVRARAAFVARRLFALRKTKPSVDVNLVNFSDSQGPLSSLLASRGLTLLPYKKDFYGDIAAARLQVLSSADPVLTAAFDKLGVKWVAPGAPYGFTATKAWLKEVFAALGKSPAGGFGPSKKEAAAFAAAAKRLSRFAAGFVVSPAEIRMLESSWSVSGVPLVSFLGETGLSIRLFAYAPAAEEKALAKAEAAALAARTGTKPRLAFFDSPASLLKVLSGDRDLRLVYSDIPLDPRLAAAGKSAFSVAACEPGYEGALETLRRFAQLCEWDFNERYFLKKAV